MSIVAMKNKSFTLHSSHADSTGVFSLNGKYRHPPRSMGRLLYPTSMKGTVPRGYGGGSRCRLSGRFARKCGSSLAYPPQIHQTCSTLQTTVKHSVMNTSGKITKDLYCCKNIVHHFPVKKKICDHVVAVDKTQTACPPYVKEVGAIMYETRLLKLKQCLDVGYTVDLISHQC
jgi:hypothetical protein